MTNLFTRIYKVTPFVMAASIVVLSILACVYVFKQINQLGKVELDEYGLRHDEVLAIVPKSSYNRGAASYDIKISHLENINYSQLDEQTYHDGVDQNDLRADEVLVIISNEDYQYDADSSMILISSESYHKTDEQDIIIRDDELLVIKSKADYN